MADAAAALRAQLRAAGPLVSAGAFAGDLADLRGAVGALEAGGARLVHLDVGDGRYSPLLIGGPAEVAAVHTRALKDVHLMVEEPLHHLERFAAAGADAITVQVDAGRHPLQLLRTIGALANANDPGRPILRGAGLPVDLPVGVLAPLLDELDLVLVLGVVPGFKGPTAAGTADRVAAVRHLAAARGADVLISVDGGITRETAPALAAAGADVLVAGSALFAGADPDPAAAVRALSAAAATI